ncbi:MAG: class I SAM-dependent methyltransferase [Chroococcidiopsidaceae cyanobacterium CP_BM_RX_35]|nr:class I SAM-dependent methyltransferase [Chroococcidiopsidaceae cyanobacterium CP_BM_RX_35]
MLPKLYQVLQQLLSATDKSSDVFTVSQKFRDDLINFFQPNKYNFLELGCYRGLTAKILADHFVKYLGVDISWKRLLIAKLSNVFNQNVRFKRFDLYKSDWDTLDFLADVVLIDAVHSYEFVRQDISNCIKRYKNAFIVFDDYGAWEGVYKAVNEAIDESRLEILQEVGARKGELNSLFPNNLGSEGLICRVVC